MQSMIKDIRFTQSISCEGFLKKQKPGLFKFFQKRFYTIRDKGNFLVWFQNKPNSPNEVPKGVLNMSEIQRIESSDKEPFIFQVVYPGRTFNLKAQSLSDRDKWVSSLSYIIEFKKKHQLSAALGSPTDKKDGWRWGKADQTIIHKVQLQNEQMMIQDAEQQDDTLSSQKTKQIMRTKKLVTNFDNEEIMDRIIGGFLLKKGKLTTLTKFKIRWFFMVSDCNLRNTSDTRRIILNQSASWVQINTIYYFEPKSQNQEFKGNIKLGDIEQMHTDVSSTPFKLVLKTAEREYTFGSKYLSQIKKWEDSINAVTSRWRTEKQYEQKRIQTFQSQQAVVFQGEVQYNDNKSYVVVKSNSLAILKEKDDYKTGLPVILEYKDIMTSQQNKDQLRINACIQVRIKFQSEGDCQKVQKALLEAQRQSSQSRRKQSSQQESKVEITNKKQDDDQRNSYLGRKLISNQNNITKNFYQLYAVGLDQGQIAESMQGSQIPTKHPQQPPQQLGFFERLAKMFCGGGD